MEAQRNNKRVVPTHNRSLTGESSAIAVIGFPGLGDLVRCHSLIQTIADQDPGRPIAAAFNKLSVGVFRSTDAAINAPINAVVEVVVSECAVARKSKTEIYWPSLEPVVRCPDRAIETVL